MASGGYVICEWNGIQKSFPTFQAVVKAKEDEILAKCNTDWAPRTFGGLAPAASQYGRTTILPALFDDHSATQMAHWRQRFLTAGHQTLIAGAGASNTIPKDFKVLWTGLAFPNKEQQITEIKYQISDRKYGRQNIEEIKAYNTPALLFEEPLIINEEESFEFYGYVSEADFQRIVMLGTAYFKMIDRVLGNTGAVI